MKLLERLKFLGFFNFVSPFIPKVTIKPDGFFLNKRWLPLNDILCVYYNNAYSPYNKIFIFPGWSKYEILTKQGRIIVLGEQYDLLEYFNKNLELVDKFEDKNLGFTRRWKQPNIKYEEIYIDDYFRKKFTEPLNKVNVNKRLAKLIILIIILIFIVLIIIFFISLYRLVY